MSTGLVRPSTSPVVTPTLFTPKKYRGLQMCIDYRALNWVTIKSRYLISHADELIDQLHGTRYFSKIDLRSGYHQIRVSTDDCHKTTFCTCYRSYEYTVILFGLTNAPSTFQLMVNGVFRDLLDKCVIIYMDDIPIHTTTLEEGVKIDPRKIRAIQEWKPPTNLKEVQWFLGFVNYVHRFIPNMAGLTRELTDLLHKATEYNDIAIGALLLQDFSDSLQPITYEWRKLQLAERNYPVHDREMLAIMHTYTIWRCYLTGADVTIQIDHKSLQYLRAQPNLNPRQIRWLDYLESNFAYRITYKKGANNIADALSKPSAQTTAW
ncbi:hypothetical protein CLOM_g4049 [Closterium sp. NIES-68]|nr:hypothetical protein CLOM_g4049 [Closterium sp. NIES-68]